MLSYWLWRYSQPGIGSAGVIAEYKESKNRGALIASLDESDGEKILEKLDEKEIKVVPYWSRDYPERLKEISDPPAFLFYRGNWRQRIFDKTVAMVGTRANSAYGERVVRDLVEVVSHSGFSILSGLAMGIDVEVHKNQLEFIREEDHGSVPVAVVPGGPNRGYPVSNSEIYEQIVEYGLVISENLPSEPLNKGMFASRNRIVAGLAECVVVVEAPKKSGALITADLACQYNREVCAVPGSVFSRASRGTNELIIDGAHLIRNGYDLLDVLEGVELRGDRQGRENAKLFRKGCEVLEKLRLGLSDNDELLGKLCEGSLDINFLAKKAWMTPREILSILTMMEIEGKVALSNDGNIKLEMRN